MPVKKKSTTPAKEKNVEEKKEVKATPEPEVSKVEEKDNRKYHFTVGRRKTSVARVKFYPDGKGEFFVNDKKLMDYFCEPFFNDIAIAPLKSQGMEKDFDIKIKVSGGGKHSQAEAVRHGIARALVDFDQELRTTLKKSGFLSRDARAKERKKYGLKRARKGPQFSKR